MTQTLPIRGLHPSLPFLSAMREIVVSQIATVSIWATFLPMPDHAHEHHQMRIAVKQLRYSLDMADAVLSDDVRAIIKDLKSVQESLGELHDLDVLFLSVEQSLFALDQSKVSGKRHEARQARLAAKKASLEALLSSVADARDHTHQKCVALWKDAQARDVFAPLNHWVQENVD